MGWSLQYAHTGLFRLFFFILGVLCGKSGKPWVTMSVVFPFYLSRDVVLHPAVQLAMPFKMSCRPSQVKAGCLKCDCVHICSSIFVRVCVYVCFCLVGFKSFWMVFDKWHATLQKAAVKGLTNSGIIDNRYSRRRFRPSLLSVSGTLCFWLSCQGRQQDITRRREGEEIMEIMKPALLVKTDSLKQLVIIYYSFTLISHEKKNNYSSLITVHYKLHCNVFW